MQHAGSVHADLLLVYSFRTSGRCSSCGIVRLNITDTVNQSTMCGAAIFGEQFVICVAWSMDSQQLLSAYRREEADTVGSEFSPNIHKLPLHTLSCPIRSVPSWTRRD
jgi:hypothetical protein